MLCSICYLFVVEQQEKSLSGTAKGLTSFDLKCLNPNEEPP